MKDEAIILSLWQRWDKIIDTHSGYFLYIINAYDEPHRHYHTTQHLFDVMEVFDSAKHLVDDPITVQLALFYHDIVYDPKAYDNELKSSKIMMDAFKDKLDSYIINNIHRLIMATRHKAKGYEGDNRYIVDIDIAILGSAPDTYKVYSDDIRKEYSMYDDTTYKEGRIKLMKKFLDRDHIYSTSVMRNRYEQLAIENISDEIKRLSV